MRYIAVLDCNNFFVSCERLFRPDLRQKPVVVLSSNDGCVVARSQEIKDKGIGMGVPYFQIKDTLKDIDATCFSSNFTLYRDVSDRVFQVLRSLVTEMEIYSIDEAFFIIEAATAAEAELTATTIKSTVERRVGIPVSIGVATSKTLAKLCNDIAKKDRRSGVFVLEPGDSVTVLGTRPLGDVWGIGGRLSRRYASAGLHTIADMHMVSRERLQTISGVVGLRTQAELLGQVAYPLSHRRELPKSITSSRSFGQKTNDIAVIKDALAYHVRSVAADLRRDGLVAGSMTILLLTARHSDWFLRGGATSVTFTVPTADTTTLLKEALRHCDQIYETGVPYNKTGVVLSALLPARAVPASLFSTEDAVEAEGKLDSLIDSLNTRFGNDLVKLGMFTKTASWRTRQETLSPAYTTNWQELPVVKAI